MREKVAIVGGGIAGLSAAHELVLRGFEVHVYERRAFLGGKAASYAVPQGKTVSAGSKGREPDEKPGEHGFRFFPGWYRHLTHTLERIPYYEPGGGRRSVADNLVSIRSNVAAWFDRAPLELPLQVPTSASEAVAISQVIGEFSRLGLSSGEAALFFRKVVEFVAMSEERREAAFEGVSWWDYLECDKPGRSQAYRDLARATTRTSVAAKAEEVSAFTVGRLVVRTLLDTMGAVDRVLNGPTSEVWIDPWVSYLESCGVTFHRDLELESISFDSKSRKVRALTMVPTVAPRLRSLRRKVSRLLRFAKDKRLSPAFIEDVAILDTALADDDLLDPSDVAKTRSVLKEARRTFRADYCKGFPPNEKEPEQQSPEEAAFEATCKALDPLLSTIEGTLSVMECDKGAPQEVEAHYFVLALPLEQLAYYVNRSTMLTFLAPELKKTIPLARHMDWMAGIQFYLRSQLDLPAGHLVGIDSDWALTAVEHTQFWKDVELPSSVKAVLSVDISAWDRKGRKVRKEAFYCNEDEIAEEVFWQLKEMLNRPNRMPILREDMLVGGELKKDKSYHLDQSIVDLYDRKKQAFYERARGLPFSVLDETADAENDGITDEYMWGPKRVFNAEPILVNRVGSRRYRPDACTSIPNLFLAGDYVKTDTDLACMEAANEAARIAVNGILDAAASRETRCELWQFSPSRQAIEGIMSMGTSLKAVRSVASVVSRIQDRLFRGFGGE